MPELPEVETVRRALLPFLLKQQIQKITILEPRLRWPVQAAAMQQAVGQTVLHIERRAKYLLIHLANQSTIVIHLGMSGVLGIVEQDEPYKRHDHIAFLLSSGQELRYCDPRRFGMVEWCSQQNLPNHPRLQHLGLEPLDISAEQWRQLRTGKVWQRGVKLFLLDGRKVAGIGNIYACEALYQAGIWPWQPVSQIKEASWQQLRLAMQQVLLAAIAAGGTTLRDFRSVRGEAGYFVVNLQCYGKAQQSCPRCTATIVRIAQQGRSTFFCPTCQPPPA